MDNIIKQTFNINFNYDIFFTENSFQLNNKTLLNIFTDSNNKTNKVIIFIDKKILYLHVSLKNDIKEYFKTYSNNILLVCDPIAIPGGERLKNRYLFLKIFYRLIEKYKICRQSYIISIGGGSLQDFIGYLASTAHRGIKLIRFPTTVLSQDDSGVGVKNGINYNNKKNFIGCFSVPYAVINDYLFLNSLPHDKLIEGFSEAIKVALIKDSNLFKLIEDNIDDLNNRKSGIIKQVIYHCAKLHADHISKNGDPFEILSSRPLDFGHWLAHKIESMSKYKISHGESVAIGLVVDCTYAYFIGFLSRNDWKRILNVFLKLKFKIYTDCLNIKVNNYYKVFDGLEEFREHLGGKLTITLIRNIGSKIDVHHVNKNFYARSILFLKKLNAILNKYDNK